MASKKSRKPRSCSRSSTRSTGNSAASTSYDNSYGSTGPSSSTASYSPFDSLAQLTLHSQDTVGALSTTYSYMPLTAPIMALHDAVEIIPNIRHTSWTQNLQDKVNRLVVILESPQLDMPPNAGSMVVHQQSNLLPIERIDVGLASLVALPSQQIGTTQSLALTNDNAAYGKTPPNGQEDITSLSPDANSELPNENSGDAHRICSVAYHELPREEYGSLVNAFVSCPDDYLVGVGEQFQDSAGVWHAGMNGAD